MGNSSFQHIARFIILVILQVLIFNHINFMGFVNPFPYIWFILLLPIESAQWKILIYSFLIGLTIDIFEDTGGIHAASSLVVGLLRGNVLRFCFGVSYDFKNLKFSKTPFLQRLSYIFILTLTHHLVLFFMEYFSVDHILYILKDTLYHSIFTIIILSLFNFFQGNQKRF